MIQGGQRFFQGGQSGMNSLLAPGLHPFSPHFSPQKSGKPETVSVNLWMRKTERILSVDTFGKPVVWEMIYQGFSQIPQLIMEDDDRSWLGLGLVLNTAATV